MTKIGFSNPSALAAMIEEGLTHHRASRLQEAEAVYRRVLAAKPNHPDALHLLGVIAHQAGNNEPAENLIRQAIAINSRVPDYHSNLGNVLKELGKLDAAIAVCRRALELKPDFPEAHNNLGAALKEQGRLEDAVAACQTALSLKPNLAEAHNNLGNALKSLGWLEDAVAACQRALELNPNYPEAHYIIAQCKTFKKGDPEIAAMEVLVADSALDDGKKLVVFFALGKALEDIGDYDRAFDCFASGNRLEQRSAGFDIAAEETAAERLMAVFDEALFARLDGVGHGTETPVFIVGMPRSGTSLIEQIIASHPDVHGAGESMALGRIVRELPHGYPDCVSDIEELEWGALGRSYMERLLKDAPAARRVTDKMPRNIERVGLIHLMLPRARVIHCMRDPLDTCLSCYTLRFERSQDFTYDLTDLGRYFRLYERLVDHWRRVLPGMLLDVRYEDVVDDLEGSARRMVDFCGLEWNDACLEYHKNDRIVRTASAAQVRRPIYTNSVGRWRRYERRLTPLIEALNGG